MLFRTHVSFGMFIYLLLFSYLQNPLLTLIGFIIGIVIVDIDTKKSKIGKAWYFRPIQWFTKHRKTFHTLFFGIIVTSIIAIFHVEIAFGFMVGFLSHLILDAMTLRGVAPIYPLTKRKISGHIRTGGIGEDIIFVLLLLTDISLILINVVVLLG